MLRGFKGSEIKYYPDLKVRLENTITNQQKIRENKKIMDLRMSMSRKRNDHEPH